ncbi:DUF5372 family protein [Candidatus Chlorohelix allophototropha]|uniref:DUF5372 family protein n=1 Tax=Candidatus Chlorohelix allophototropha TaxID=3003348 RepID=UPI00311AA243
MNGSPNIPNQLNEDEYFQVTHPFHPLTGQRFVLLSKTNTYGESRVFFLDPSSAKLRSLPAAWTDQAPLDPFTRLTGGQALLRLSDLRKLVQFLENWDNHFPKPQFE